MLLQENFAEEHIRELQRTSRRDPVLWNVLYMRLDCWKHLRGLVCPLFSKVAPALCC